ncbi:hypothetical protein [Bacillus cereus]|uniref:hypothetical protein n=1 Tax=Bacillus cereus TaxID=1396 RepID=UPI001F492177|nr:hypothetical protein [Bacillus cereus]BCC80253.1 hypothetical protein BCJMU62_p43 [Bacillus cereus]
MILSKQYRIPKELHEKFKATTKKTGTTMNNALCHLIAEYVYRMEQLGLPEVKESTIFHVEPVEEEIKPKPKLRKPAKKKKDGEKNEGSKKDKAEAEKDSSE